LAIYTLLKGCSYQDRNFNEEKTQLYKTPKQYIGQQSIMLLFAYGQLGVPGSKPKGGFDVKGVGPFWGLPLSINCS